MAWKWPRVILTLATKMSLVPVARTVAQVSPTFSRYRSRVGLNPAQTYYVASRLADVSTTAARNIIRKTFRRYKAKMSRRSMPKFQRQAPARGKQTTNSGDGAGTLLAYRKLYAFYMPNPAAPVQPKDFNVRERAHVYYSGYKICRTFENIGTTKLDVFTCTYMIIQMAPRALFNIADTDAPTTAQVQDFLRKDFFRDTSLNTSSMASEFVDAPTSGNVIWQMKYNCNPINPNKQFSIVYKKKFMLYPGNSAENDYELQRASYKKIEFYLPIKRRVQFRDKDAGAPVQPFLEVFWYHGRTSNNHPANNQGAVTDLETHAQHTLYYRG